MDDADRSDSDQRITDTVDDGIAAARRALAAGNSLCAIGICHWCETPIKTGRVFCSTPCSDLWQHEQDRRKAMGLK